MQLEALVDNIPDLAADPICVAYRQSQQHAPAIRWVNPAFCDTFGIAFEDAVGMPSYDLFHADYLADFLAAVEEMTSAGKTTFSVDTLCLRHDGSAFWGGISFVAIPDKDGPGRHGIMMISDIDDLKNREQSAELALIENEHLLREVEAAQTRLVSSIDMIPDPFAIYDARERLVIWNPAYARTATRSPEALKKGMKKADILRISLAEGVIAEAVGQEETWLEQHMQAWRRGELSGEMLNIQGRDYKTIVSEAPNGDRVILRVDISEQLRQKHELETYAKKLEQANNEISHQALHDELTGLGNRRYLNFMLEERIAERKVNGGDLVALHVDLDRFKEINDTMGHAAGDHVLRVVADILRKRLRKGDIVARTGGDEFVVLLRAGPASSEPEMLAERLIAEIGRPIPFEDRLCRLGASIGIARTPVIEAEALLTSSDIALYKAKQGGRSMLAVFDHIDLENMRAGKRLSDDILRAIDEEEFVPAYQAQVNPFENRVVGFEVLARWQHPKRGLLAPDAFMDAASEMQLTGQIDGIVFRRALSECQVPFATLDAIPTLAFNVSQQRIMNSQLDDDLQWSEYPGRIAFELIETVFVDRVSDEFLKRLKALRAYGVTFEVDDFGSGHASILGLRQIAADRLKIDHPLVQPITTSESARKLVQSIIDIGRALDIAVTAEGVETEDHARILMGFGCDRLQGYHFSGPMLLPDALTFLGIGAQPRTGTDN